jgi:hypothetical protein
MSKWFYDTSPGTATTIACGGSLIGATRALHAKQDEHGGLRDSVCRNVISYVHGRMGIVLLCVLFNSRVELT